MDFRQAGNLFRESLNGWNAINAPRLGAALAFYAVLSMAPLLVIFVAIARLALGAQVAQGRVVEQVGELAGYAAAHALQSVLLHASKSTGVIAGIAGLITLWFGASGVMVELHDSLNLVWSVPPRASSVRGMLESRAVSFLMILGVGFLLLASLLLSTAIAVVGKFFSGFLPAPEALLHLTSSLVSLAVTTVLFAMLFKVVPDTRIEWQDVWVGAAVTATLFSVGKFLIGFYLGKAGVGSAYGAAASLVVFLVWVYYSAQVFFLGAEFTRVYALRHGSRAPSTRRPFLAGMRSHLQRP